VLAYARALAGGGRFEQSRDQLLECISLAAPDSDALRARLAAECAGIERLLGRHGEARVRLETALQELQDAGSPEAVALTLELASDRLLQAEYDTIQTFTSRALMIARALGDPALVAAAGALQALASAFLGETAEAQARCDETSRKIDALADDALGSRLDSLVHLATAEMYLDRFEASGRHAERALRIGRATGQGELFPLIFPMLGTALWLQGRIAESARILDDAIDGARLRENTQGLAWNLFNRSFAATAAGDVETALATARESAEVAQRLDDSLITAHAAWALAAPLLETGRAADAAELMISSIGGEELRLIPGGWRVYGVELLTRCLLEAGRRVDAGRAAAAAEAWAASFDLPMPVAIAARARATIALEEGDAATAATAALASAEALEGVGNVYDAAVSRALAGCALAQAGERERACDELERAAAAFTSFGSTRQRAKVEHELRRLGRRFQSHSRAGDAYAVGVASLSGRELEVARLIVDRKTNTEIAAELFLSGKTVETHVRNMFRKLGVSSRVELARTVEAFESTPAQAKTSTR
jgi:DNA-binding NarL/FixJ family response regulator